MSQTGGQRWPFRGRDDDLARIVAWYGDPDVGGVVLTGPAGVGKSSLASAAADAVAGSAVRLAGNPALRGVPFGALAHLIPPHAVDEAGDVDRVAVIETLRPQSDRLLLVVDDPVDLDEGTLGIAAQLVTSGAAFLVAAARAEAPLPPALVALERSSAVRRLGVDPLEVAVIRDVVTAVLEGPISDAAAIALTETSGGNPLYLRELVDHALADGSLVRDTHGEWDLTAPVGPSRRLVELIADRIGRLPDDQLRLAKLLSLAAPLRWSTIERAGYGETLVELEQVGVVVVDDDPDPTIRLGHPLQHEVLRSGLRTLERRRFVTEIIAMLTTDDATVEEQLRVAEWQLSLGARPDRHVLELGAHRAWSARDLAAAEQFATAALELGPTTGMAAVLVEALIHTGRSDQADVVAARYLDLDPGDDPRARNRLVGLRVFNNLWYRERPDDAAAVVAAERRTEADRVGDDELFIQEAYVELARADADAVLRLIEGRDWSDEVAPQGLLLTAQMLGDTGRVLDGRSVIESAAAAARVDAAMSVSSPGSIDAARVRLATLAGELDQAAQLVEELGQRDEYRSDPFVRGYLLLSAGRIELWRGRPRRARRHFNEGRRVGEQQANRVIVMGCAAGLGVAAGYLGDVDACGPLLDELEGYELARVVRPSLATGIAWSLVATGHPARARTLLVDEAARSAERRERSDAAGLAFEAARIGGGTEVRPILEALVGDVDGLPSFCCRAGLALLSGGAAELELVSRRRTR